MNLRLIELKIRNFKGLLSFDFSPGGKDAELIGDNGAGKTTVYDAYCWLLFGCDSHDNTAFAIEPRDDDGNVVDPNAVTEVEGVFDIDGDELRLIKRNMQIWERVRGRAELTYKGNTNTYEINGAPCTMTDYYNRLSEICDLDMLRVLSGVYRFANLEWTQQRVMLFDMLDMSEDSDIMAGAEGKFSELRDMMIRTGSDFNAVVDMIKRGRKSAVEAVGRLPAAIEENRRYLSDQVKEVQRPSLDAEMETLSAAIDALIQKRAAEMSNVRLAEIMAEKRAAESDIRALNAENEAYIREQRSLYDISHDISRLRRDNMEADQRLQDAREGVARCKKEMKRISGLLDDLRKRYEETQERAYSGEDVCPRCGRRYDEEALCKARQHFEDEKNAVLAEIAAEGKATAEKHNAAQAEMIAAFKREKEAEKEVAELHEKLTGIKPFEPSDMDGYAEKLKALTDKRDDLGRREEFEHGCLDKIIADYDREIGEKKARMAEINRLMGDIERQDTVTARIEQLEDELKAKTEHVNYYDRLLFLADEYTVYKAEKAEEGVNALFEDVRFRLFEKQKNGGMRYYCEATVNGIGYNKNLNSAARVNAGLDIIIAFSKRYGIFAPVFVDNAESVTNLKRIPGQMFLLHVEKGSLLSGRSYLA